MATTPSDRLRENAAELAGTVVTGVWLAALVTGQDWWLAALLIGYVVVVPVVAMLFGDGDEEDEGREDDWEEESAGAEHADSVAPDKRDALETLRERYARGELTDEQFERKLERLLESESLEDLEDRARERERDE